MLTLESRIRVTLEDKYGCKYEPTHKVHFFSNTSRDDLDEQTTVWFLDSLYCALFAPEPVVALRAYVQACEYSATQKHRPLRYQWESALYEARTRVESFVKGGV